MPVVVNGVKELQKAMRDVDPALNKEMSKNIKVAMTVIQNTARGYLPTQDQVLSGWGKGTSSADTINYRAFPAYDYALARSLIKYSAGTNKRNRAGFRAAFYVANISAPGAIFETAGRKNRNGAPNSQSLNPNAGVNFIESAENLSTMKGEGKQKGRLIYRAWSEEKDKVIPAVVKAIDTVAIKFIKDTEIRKAA